MLLLPEFTQRRRLQEKYRRVRLRDLDFYLIDKRKKFQYENDLFNASRKTNYINLKQRKYVKWFFFIF